MAFGPISALKTGIAAAPLFIGENSIFSGKGRQASKMLERTFNQSQSLGLPNEYNQYLQNKLFNQNRGLSSSALGLYNQQMSRNQSSMMRQLSQGQRGGMLAGIGAMSQMGSDSALKLAGMEQQQRDLNRQAAEQAMLTVGGLKRTEQLRKLDEAANYWGTRKAESNASISSALKGVGSALGSSLGTGAYGEQNAEEQGLGKFFKGLFKRN